MARWRIHFVSDAERDVSAVIEYSAATFGARQAKVYETTLTLAFMALRAGPGLRGSIAHNELGTGIRSLHVARGGRRGRHMIIYRELPGRTIEVLRVLHDAMDLARHVPKV